MPSNALRLYIRAATPPGPQPWTPDDLGANLTGHWDATETDTLTIVSDAVSAWDSLVGSHSLTQATASARPAYSATGWDGTLPCLTGDGLATNGDILVSATGPFATTQSIFVVAERGTQNNDAASSGRPPLSGARSSGGARLYMTVQKPATDAPQTLFIASAAGVGAVSSSVTPFTIGEKAVLFSQFATDDLRARINDGAQGSAGAFGAGTAADFCLFGSTDAATHRFAGKIAEIMVINRLLTNEVEFQNIFDYLAAKWLEQDSAPSLDFSDPDNSQYIPVIF